MPTDTDEGLTVGDLQYRTEQMIDRSQIQDCRYDLVLENLGTDIPDNHLKMILNYLSRNTPVTTTSYIGAANKLKALFKKAELVNEEFQEFQ